MLIKRLENHVLTNPTAMEYVEQAMTASQVQAALGLLAKVVPNVSENNTNHTGTLSLNLGLPWLSQAIQDRN